MLTTEQTCEQIPARPTSGYAPNMSGLEFFQDVHPPEGYTFIATFSAESGGKMQHYSVQGADAAAAMVLRLDKPGIQVFSSCASYLTPDSRKADNARSTGSFWGDLDAGPRKPYATQSAAFRALVTFEAALGLPQSMVIKSGSGLHAYWLTTASVLAGEWKVTATLLKASMAKWGLLADPSRTADIASLLRPVGSTNRKGKPKQVTCARRGVPADSMSIRAILEAYMGFEVEDGDFLSQRPVHVLETGNLNSDLTAGLGVRWFEQLPPAQKDACLEEMLAVVRDLADGSRTEWIKIVAACARSGAPSAEALCEAWSKQSLKYDPRGFASTFASF